MKLITGALFAIAVEAVIMNKQQLLRVNLDQVEVSGMQSLIQSNLSDVPFSQLLRQNQDEEEDDGTNFPEEGDVSQVNEQQGHNAAPISL